MNIILIITNPGCLRKNLRTDIEIKLGFFTPMIERSMEMINDFPVDASNK
jgi:hypothetical protein